MEGIQAFKFNIRRIKNTTNSISYNKIGFF